MFSCAQTTRDLLFFVAQPLRFAAKAGAFSCAFEPGRTHRGALTKNPHPFLKCGKGGLHDFGVFLLAVPRNSGVLESGDKASAFAFNVAPGFSPASGLLLLRVPHTSSLHVGAHRIPQPRAPSRSVATRDLLLP